MRENFAGGAAEAGQHGRASARGEAEETEGGRMSGLRAQSRKIHGQGSKLFKAEMKQREQKRQKKAKEGKK
jgi:hypothetical protein